MRLSLFLFLTTVPGALGRPEYKNWIPNAGLVPHPCADNIFWLAVGHLAVDGSGGTLDAFGVHFYVFGRRWTQTLCQTDSDGDGRTNGEELGDPNCSWTQGQTPDVTTGITHPGICEPTSTVQCQLKSVPHLIGNVTYATQEQWLADVCNNSDQFTLPTKKDTGTTTVASSTTISTTTTFKSDSSRSWSTSESTKKSISESSIESTSGSTSKSTSKSTSTNNGTEATSGLMTSTTPQPVDDGSGGSVVAAQHSAIVFSTCLLVFCQFREIF